MTNPIQQLYVRTSEIPALLAALQTRNEYLQGLIRRQLNYRPTATRNRKLEALEAEQLQIERLYYTALGQLKPIFTPPTAPPTGWELLEFPKDAPEFLISRPNTKP